MSLYDTSSVGCKEENQEESGWTEYLQDFSGNNHDYSFVSSPSLLSDAASDAARRRRNKNMNFSDHTTVKDYTKCGSQVLKRLNLKHSKTNKTYSDPDLEDTASSPINSPKDSGLKQVEINARRTEKNVANYLGKEGFQEMGMGAEERCSINFDGKITECTDLRKRGLCLMPLSLLVNYHKQSF